MLLETWQQIVKKKNSLLCVGIDPAVEKEREEYILPNGISKTDWCISVIRSVAPYSAAIKINRNYIKDLSQNETRSIVQCIHDHGMLAIDDSKLCDIGDSNEMGLIHAKLEGFDAVTVSPFPGNLAQTSEMAKKQGLAIFALVLMTEPTFALIQNATVNGMKGYEFFANQVRDAAIEGMVLGAPSSKNRITEAELRTVSVLTGRRLILMPGMGKQGGEAELMLKIFGDQVVVNVGRSIIYSENVEASAKSYHAAIQAMRHRPGKNS